MKKTFNWSNSEAVAFQVLADICRAEEDFFGFDLINTAPVRNGSWLEGMEQWERVRRVSRAIKFEKTIWPFTGTVRRVAIELEGVRSKCYAGGGMWWHPTRVHYDCGVRSSEYVYKDPCVLENPFRTVANWDCLYRVLENGELLRVSTGEVLTAVI